MGEIRDLVKNPSDGIRYAENDEDTVSEIHAVMDGPGISDAHLLHLFSVITYPSSSLILSRGNSFCWRVLPIKACYTKRVS